MANKLLSLVVLTHNEEMHLKRCLESAKSIAGQIVVVDSGSADRTLEIARSFKADIYHHPFKNQADQFNWVLDHTNIKGEWILRLDADEYLTPELMREIPEVVQTASPEITGFYMKRRVFFLGRWIRHGGYYPRWFLRLFRKGKARSEEREMDEHIVLFAGEAGNLKNDFIDENLKDLFSWTQKHNDFSTREASSLLSRDAGEAATGEDRKRSVRKSFYMKLPLFLRAWWYFIYRFIFRAGFLDGVPGVIFHFLQGFWYRFLIDAKVYEARKKKSV